MSQKICIFKVQVIDIKQFTNTRLILRIVIAWRKLIKGVESFLLGCTRQYVYKLVEQGKLSTSRLLEAMGQQAYYRHVGGIVIVEELAEPLQPSSLAVVHRQ